MPVISKIYTYPIKSCKGVSLETSALRDYGLSLDRHCMIVDNATKMFLSQRSHPKLALVTTAIGYQDGAIVVSAEGMPELRIIPTFVREAVLTVTVHTSSFVAFDQGKVASEWFSTFLNKECRLVAVPERAMRLRWLKGFDEPMKIACHDSSPLHVVCEASLARLNQMIGTAGGAPVTMDRFRPNIVIGRCPAFEEQISSALKIGDVHLNYRKLTLRCGMINIRQSTAEQENEPLKTFAKHVQEKSEVCFGAYFIPKVGDRNDGEKMISVGQHVEMVL